MSNAVFPDLPGIEIRATKTPEWSTEIQQAVSGKELRAANWSYPKWHFTVSYEVLRAGAEAELQTLIGFFCQRKGAFDNFLFTDPDDCAVTDQPFGTGNGTTTQFQLVRTLGGFIDPVKAPNGTPTIKVAGVATGSFSLDANTGIVTFFSPPTNGAALTWSGSFYFRVRFVRDTADFERFLHDLWQLKKLELVSVK